MGKFLNCEEFGAQEDCLLTINCYASRRGIDHVLYIRTFVCFKTIGPAS